MNEDRNILDHLAVLVRWRRMIVISFVVVTGATAGVSYVLPEAYRAGALVYPPSKSQDLGGLSAIVGNLPLNLLGGGSTALSATDFVPVIKSARVAEAVAERFDLATRYKTETREQLLMDMAGKLEVELSLEQYLSVSYEAGTPELAAQLTNAFVEELDRALRERRAEEAAGLRAYFEERLAEALADMRAAELAYKEFQAENMAIDIETQARAQIETAGEAISGFAELLIQQEVAQRLMEPGNPKLEQIGRQVEATRAALDRMLMGRKDSDGTGQNELPAIVIPFRDIPDLGLQAVRLMRDVEIQNAIYTLVRQEYEKARLEEGKQTATVVVLDRAHPPDSRSRPRRTMMVLTAGALSLLVSVLIAFLMEGVRNLDPTDRDKIEALRREWRS